MKRRVPEPAGPAAGPPYDDSLLADIERLLGKTRSLSAITGDAAGTGSRSFVAVTRDGAFHVKQVSPHMPRLVSLTEEFELLGELAGAGICPRPVAVDAKAGLIATEQMRGYRSMTARELRQPATLGNLAVLLRELHHSRATLAAPAAVAIAESYVGDIDALAGVERDRAVEFLELAGRLDRWPGEKVVCHGDLVAANVMRGPRRHGAAATEDARRLLLIDFEYAQRAPAIFDLAGLSVMNGFVATDDASLFRHYFAGAEPPFSHGDFATVRRLVTLMAHFWAQIDDNETPGIERYRLDAEGRERI